MFEFWLMMDRFVDIFLVLGFVVYEVCFGEVLFFFIMEYIK